MSRNMKISQILVVSSACIFLTSCSTKGFIKPRSEILAQGKNSEEVVQVIKDEEENFYTPEKNQEARLLDLLKQRSVSATHDANYIIGPADEIELNVFDVPELNVTAKVRQSGFISLPLVGAIKAAGLNETELAKELSTRLASFVKNPQINTFISHYGSQRVAVMGAVQKPGTYSLTKGANSILEVIGEAGGPTDKAGSYINFIPAELSGISASSDMETRARMSLASYQSTDLKNNGIEIPIDKVMGLSGGIPLEIPIRGGDMIIIGESGQIMVEGEVGKPGSFDLGKRMTVLGALAASGGITYAAKIDEVEIIRDVGPEKKGRVVINLEKIARGEVSDIRLKNGDIVRVPSHSGRYVTQSTMEALSRVINVGVGGSVNF